MTNGLHNSRQTVGGFAPVAYPNTAILGRAFQSHRHAAQFFPHVLVKSIFFDKLPSKRSFG
jgi:hypothetical protein